MSLMGWNQLEELSSYSGGDHRGVPAHPRPARGRRRSWSKKILDVAGQKGTGLWTREVSGALERGIAVPTIYAAAQWAG